ncbi:MAG: SpoIIE family protein phosphatase [Vicinamibacterales bacterium]|nr:SpoIIE family protein phosphatase [Vicinamibacterales bacterium]
MQTGDTHDDVGELGPLLRLAGDIGREVEMDGLLLAVLARAHPWMRAEACSIFLPDAATGDLVIHSAHGDSTPQMGALRVPSGKGVVGAALAERRTIRVDDVSTDARFFSQADKQTGWTTRALLAAPLIDGDRCLGVIEFLNPVGRASFTARDEQLVDYFAGLVAAALVRVRAHEAALERAQVQRDLELARALQSGLLPRAFPTPDAAPGVELFARLEPAREVSGDFYDFFWVQPGELCFVVADVSGKGIAAGLFMAVTRTLVRAIARPGRSPREIMERVNRQLCDENDAQLFVTMMLGLLDTRTGLVRCGLGGHNPPVRVPRAGAPAFEPPGGMPLGLFDTAQFGEHEFVLDPQDSFVVYTDGVTEARNAADEFFEEDRLIATISAAHGLAPEALTQRIIAAVESFVGAAPRSDDITVLTLRRPAAAV